MAATDFGETLVSACAAAGLDPSGAVLIRLGSNAVYRLCGGRVIARVSCGTDAGCEVRVSRWLAESGIPAVRAIGEPVVTPGVLVTFWESVNDSDEYGTTAELGTLLKRLHALPAAPELALPVLTPFDRVHQRLAAAEALTRGERAFLDARAAGLAEAYGKIEFDLLQGQIHGDASVGNLLRDREGGAVLADLDGFAVGPREWDLIQTAMYFERYSWHTEAEYRAFSTAYGYDVMTWPGYRTLADVKELLMIAWLSRNATPGSAAATELHHRVETLTTDAPRDWNPF